MKDESAAYLEFLNEEVRNFPHSEEDALFNLLQAQKFTAINEGDDDDELEEESLLETPLDKVEPYSMFKHALLRKLSLGFFSFAGVLGLTGISGLQQEQPHLYENLTNGLNPDEKQIVQGAFHQADVIAAAAAQAAAAGASVLPNGPPVQA